MIIMLCLQVLNLIARIIKDRMQWIMNQEFKLSSSDTILKPNVSSKPVWVPVAMNRSVLFTKSSISVFSAKRRGL